MTAWKLSCSTVKVTRAVEDCGRASKEGRGRAQASIRTVEFKLQRWKPPRSARHTITGTPGRDRLHSGIERPLAEPWAACTRSWVWR